MKKTANSGFKGFAVTCILLFAVVLSLALPSVAQTIASLEADLSALRTKLSDPATDSAAREQLFRHIASRLNHVGDIRWAAGEFDLASAAFVEADAAIRSMHELAYIRTRKDLEEAEKTLAGISREGGPELVALRERIVATYVAMAVGEVLDEAEYFGDDAAQRACLTRLSELARLTGDVSKQAESLEKLGRVEFEGGNSARAMELYGQARELRKKSGRYEWWALDKIADAKWYLGDLDGAIEDYREVAAQTSKLEEVPFAIPAGTSEVKSEALRSERVVLRMTLVEALLNIAQINAIRGNYGAATQSVTETSAVVDRMRLSETDVNDLARSLLILSRAAAEATLQRVKGRLLEAQGRGIEAAEQYRASADLLSQLSGGSPSGAVAGLRSRLANIYSGQRKFDEARANIREALRIRARLQQESGLTYAYILAARIELAAEQPEMAMKYATDAKAVAARTKLDDVIAEAAEIEADVILASGKADALPQSIEAYRSAVDVFKRAELRPSLARAAASLGSAYEKAGDATKAEAAYKESVAAAEAMRTSFLGSDEAESFAGRGDITAIYQRLVDLLVRQGRIEEALEYATRAQRRELIDATPVDSIKMDASAGNALAKMVSADRRERSVRAKLADSRSGLSEQAIPDRKVLEADAAKARAEYEAATKQLEKSVPDLRVTIRPTDLAGLRSRVGPTSAVVSYLVTSDRLFIFVVRSDGVMARTVPVSRSDLRLLVARVREGLKAFGDDFYDLSSDPTIGFAEEQKRPDLRVGDQSDHYRKTLASANASLRTLYQKLIAPIEGDIAGANVLTLVPNAELFLLPFAALVSAEGSYLLEKYALNYATAGDLLGQRKTVQPSSMLVAFGNPTEANLDGALEEVKAIRRVFPRSTIYTEDQATKTRLFALKSAKILHFATHGHIKSPAQSSTIQLAHLPNIVDPDLTYGEIWKLPIGASDMVVLSACETALGGVSGSEAGVFIEAFRKITNSVAASLWPVDDFATRTLMVEFYRNLARGQSRAASMRGAQLKLLRDGRTKNPLFWAAFVLYGEGGRLTGAATAVPRITGGKTRR